MGNWDYIEYPILGKLVCGCAEPDWTPSASSIIIVSRVFTSALSSSNSCFISSNLVTSVIIASHPRNLSLVCCFSKLAYKQDRVFSESVGFFRRNNERSFSATLALVVVPFFFLVVVLVIEVPSSGTPDYVERGTHKR